MTLKAKKPAPPTEALRSRRLPRTLFSGIAKHFLLLKMGRPVPVGAKIVQVSKFSPKHMLPRAVRAFPPRAIPSEVSGVRRYRKGIRHAEQEFKTLTRDWKAQSEVLSSPIEIAMLPAYQRIVGMGRVAVPLILQELQREPDFWFWALRSITGADPVTDEERGDLQAMTDAWLKWARRQGFLLN